MCLYYNYCQDHLKCSRLLCSLLGLEGQKPMSLIILLFETLQPDQRIYSQTRIKCSRPISSLRGLQGQKPKAHYYFTFWNSTVSVFMKFLWDQLVLSYSTHGSQKSRRNQKNREKINFRAQFWSTSDQNISMKFHMVFAIILNLNLWIHKKICMSTS